MKALLPTLISALPLLVLVAGILLSLLVDTWLPRRSTRLVQGVIFSALSCTLTLLIMQFKGMNTLKVQELFTNDFWGVSLLFLIVLCAFVALLNVEPLLQRRVPPPSAQIIMTLFACLGLGLAVSTHHLLACFLGLELFGLSTRSLLHSHGGTWKSGEALLKSFVISSVSSGILLLGIGFIFAAFGTLDLHQINNLVVAPTQSFLPTLGVAFVLVGLFSKLGIVPFQAWLTDVSEGAPPPWSGFIVATVPLACVGFLLRFVINANVMQIPHLKICLLVFAGLSIIWGSFVALQQEELKRFTACLVTAQTGLILLVLALGLAPQGLTSNTIQTIFLLLITNTILTLGVFSVLSTLMHHENNDIHLSRLQGLFKTNPITSLALAVFFFGFAGIPLTLGLMAKYRALWIVVQTGNYLLIAGFVLTSVVFASSCFRPVMILFMKEPTTQTLRPTLTVPTTIAITLCLFLTISLGINPGILIKMAGLIESVLR